MFLDEVTITVIGGHGGRGCVAFRREKYVPKGGPDGGDGGDGGDVYLVVNDDTDTLGGFSSSKTFEASRGKHGKGKTKNGKAGKDLILKVPPGTQVYSDKLKLADLVQDGDKYLIAKGGKGGYGNAHFKSSIRQTPDFAELGDRGEEKEIRLELKLVADVGIIGYPSVGKSTLISVISSARPKIADYPFTTIVPNLGVVDVEDRSYVVCDVPGLIEGASEGKGLGDKFLRHIERCGILVHMLDISRALEGTEVNAEKLKDDYAAIRNELKAYSPALSKKKELVIVNKIDLSPDKYKEVKKELKEIGVPVFMSISSATKDGTDLLTKKMLPLVLEERDKRDPIQVDNEEIPTLKPLEDSNKMGAFHIDKKADGSIIVTGNRIEQFTRMTDFSKEGAIMRFKDVLERIGLKNVLVNEGFDKVFIGDVAVEKYL